MKIKTILNPLFSFVIAASVLACTAQKSGTAQNDSSKDDSSKDEKATVSLTISVTSNYCGGVPPTEQMVANLKTPKKFSNQKFYISNKEALQENMKEMTTSTSGSVSASLAEGTYFVFLPEKVSAEHSGKDRSEKECNKWKNIPNGTFTVGKDSAISFNIHKTCDGCGALRM